MATPFGQPLYESIGFKTVERIVRLIAPEGTSLLGAGAALPMTDTDFPLALKLDRITYGADRSLILRHRWPQAEGGAMLSNGTGFAWKTAQRGGLVIGPVIASSAKDALHLVARLTAGFPGRIKIEVPERHTKLITLLTSGGFVIDSSRSLMLKGAETLPGHREMLYGLASLGFC